MSRCESVFHQCPNLDGAGLRNYDMMTFGNSVLAGLVAITSSCSTVYPWAAIIIGIVAGLVYNIGSEVHNLGISG